MTVNFNQTMFESLKLTLLNAGLKIIYALVILFIGFKIVNFLEKMIEKTRVFKKLDETFQSFLRAAIRMTLKILVIISVLRILGVETTAFVAVIGAAGLAVGLSLQGSLSNLAAGVILVLLRPFKVGDYITGAGHDGTVNSIGLFYTNLTTVDNKAIVIPNSDLANSSVINYNEHATRRVDLTFGVGYGSDIKTVKKTILDVIEQNEMILKDTKPFIRLANHGESSLDFNVRVWVKTEDYWEVHFTLLEDVKEAFDKVGIEIPYPQVVIHTEKEEA